MPELPGRPLVGVDSVDVPERLAEDAANVRGVEWPSDGRGEGQPVFLPLLVSSEPVPERLHAAPAEMMDHLSFRSSAGQSFGLAVER